MPPPTSPATESTPATTADQAAEAGLCVIAKMADTIEDDIAGPLCRAIPLLDHAIDDLAAERCCMGDHRPHGAHHHMAAMGQLQAIFDAARHYLKPALVKANDLAAILITARKVATAPPEQGCLSVHFCAEATERLDALRALMAEAAGGHIGNPDVLERAVLLVDEGAMVEAARLLAGKTDTEADAAGAEQAPDTAAVAAEIDAIFEGLVSVWPLAEMVEAEIEDGPKRPAATVHLLKALAEVYRAYAHRIEAIIKPRLPSEMENAEARLSLAVELLELLAKDLCAIRAHEALVVQWRAADACIADAQGYLREASAALRSEQAPATDEEPAPHTLDPSAKATG